LRRTWPLQIIQFGALVGWFALGWPGIPVNEWRERPVKPAPVNGEATRLAGCRGCNNFLYGPFQGRTFGARRTHGLDPRREQARAPSERVERPG